MIQFRAYECAEFQRFGNAGKKTADIKKAYKDYLLFKNRKQNMVPGIFVITADDEEFEIYPNKDIIDYFMDELKEIPEIKQALEFFEQRNGKKNK